MVLLIVAIAFVPSKVSRKKRAIIGVLHVSAHLSAALILMLLLELGVETCIRHKLLATSGEFFLQLCGYFCWIFAADSRITSLHGLMKKVTDIIPHCYFVH